MNIEHTLKKYPQWIKAIYKTGSSVLPWIDKSNDIDYVIFVSSLDDSRLYQFYEERPKGECWFVAIDSTINNPRLYSYERPFEQLLCGEEMPTERYDIFENEKEYKAYVIQQALGRPYDNTHKCWYHTLTAIYLFDNGGYFLTEEQKANVVLCKNKQMTVELHNFIQTRLKEWQEELCQ